MIKQIKEYIPNTPVKFFMHFIKKKIFLFSLLVILSLGWSLDNSLWPLVFKFIITKITNFNGNRENIFGELQHPLLLALFLWITVDVFFRLQGIISIKIFPQFEASIRSAVREFCLHHSVKYFTENMVGNIASKVIDLPRCATSIVRMLISLILPVLFSIILSSTLLWSINKWLSLFLIIWCILHMAVCIKLSNKCNYLSFEHSKAKNTLNGVIIDSFKNYLNVKIFSNYRFEKEYATQFQEEEINKYKTTLWGIEKVKIFLSIISITSVSLIIWSTFYFFSKNKIDLGDLVLILNTTYNISLMSWSTGLEFPRLFQEIGNLRQALTILEREEDTDPISSSKPSLDIINGLIFFDKITFSYDKTNIIFDELSLLIQSGEKIGIVGTSGSGKSTLVNLLLRHYQLDNGSIYIDNHNLEDFNHVSIYNNIAICTQEISLFNRSIQDNILYGNVNATFDEIVYYSKKACCHEFIEKLPNGYNTVIGENGLKLSGGERQRIAIARTLLKRSKILILDEATSALDVITENQIYNNIKCDSKQTKIIITHRLASLTSFQNIIVLEKGRIIGSGSHNYLIENCLFYKQLWKTQNIQS